MDEDRKREKEKRKGEKEERKRREREEKARRGEERKEIREARKREKLEALQELRELPSVKRGEGEELRCGAAWVKDAENSPKGGASAPSAVAEEQGYLPAGEGGEGDTAEVLSLEEEKRVAVEESLPREKGGAGEGGEEREGWFSRLRRGLSRSRTGLVAPLARAMAARRFDDAFWEEVEDILVGADVGMEMTMLLVNRVREIVAKESLREPEELMAAFREVVADALDQGERSLRFADSGPSVFIVVGVNGTGKTTTIAKLAHLLRREGKRVLLAAGDTFRAAGIEQLETWGERVGVHTVKHRQGSDAAAVIHDAVESALARGMDVVIADTAGRLHTKANLMEELKKIKRVAERNAPVTETLLVIDATTGQNGLIQARQFREAVEVTGVVLTKLDGTAKGGIVVAIAHELGIPIKLIGVGEKLDDLHPFDPREFADALFS